MLYEVITNEMPVSAVSSSVIPQNIPEKRKFDNEERNILQLMIRFGQSVMFYNDEAKTQPVSVASYILEELDRDKLRFDRPLHQSMMEDYIV